MVKATEERCVRNVGKTALIVFFGMFLHESARTVGKETWTCNLEILTNNFGLCQCFMQQPFFHIVASLCCHYSGTSESMS